MKRAEHVVLWHVNILPDNARDTHTAINRAEVFSLFLCNLRMYNDVTQQCLEFT
jgi:hypothetical protein